MEQVRALIADKNIHPAAPIVLAGAALEVALRSAVEELQLALKERPSISAYARRLREGQVLSAQDVKDVEQMAGVRNSAAHGNFEELSPERAGLLEQQVNFFLSRLTGILESRG
jgi:pyocin large subunit-like protein